MFRDASGSLYEFLKSLGRPMDDCGNETPLKSFPKFTDSSASLRSAGNNNAWLIAHLNELTASDFDLLERSNSKFHIVHCPRSHNYFGHRPFAFERLRSLGFNICLGTDSLASNESLSLFAEMRAFQKRLPGVSADQIFQMVTVNPARALRIENALGQIRAGFKADLISIPSSGPTDIFEQIIAYENHVNWVPRSSDQRQML